MKKSEERMFEKLVEFCDTHENPSIFAIQEYLGIDYIKAAKLRNRLINNGLAVLLEKKQIKEKTDIVFQMALGDIVVTKISNYSL